MIITIKAPFQYNFHHTKMQAGVFKFLRGFEEHVFEKATFS